MPASEKFQYTLGSLLKKRRLDQDVARSEEAAARQVVKQRRMEMQAVEQTIEASEKELRERCTHGKELDTARQNVLLAYLAHQREELKKKTANLDQATAAHEKILLELDHANRGVKTLEKHKESRQAQFRVEWQRLEQRRADELWLLRERRSDVKSLYRTGPDET